MILYNQLKALNFIHSANIIHRDLKPANFLLDQNNEVIICDFGMARIIPTLNKHEKDIKEYKKKEYKHVITAAKNESGEEIQIRVNHFKNNVSSKLQEHMLKRQQKNRDLTPAVMSRWYRPPEIIMCSSNYN